MGEAYIKGAYGIVISHRSPGPHEHRDWPFEKEAPSDKLLLIWFISKYGHYHLEWSNATSSSVQGCYIRPLCMIVTILVSHITTIVQSEQQN